MSLSDDVASLKVGVHKLAVAIEELAIRKYLQGEIDISKLPWFTPQYVPGDSIKLSGSRLPTATVYSDNNEVIASPTPCFPNSSDNSLGAPKVFDQMPEPNSCSNQLKNVAAHFGGTQTPTAANLNLPCDKDAKLTMVVGQLASLNAFEKDIIHGGDSQRYANGVVRVNSQCLTPNFGVNNKLSDVHEPLSDCKLTPKPQLQSAHKLLDEMPLPTFIKEMAEATRLAELDSVQDDSTTIYEDSDDSLAYKQIFAKLGTLDGPYFWDLVILGASRARFSKVQSVVHMGSRISDKLPHQVDKSYRNSYFDYPCSQVTVNCSIILNTNHSTHFIKNILSPFLLSDLDRFIGSTLSAILGVKAYNTRVFELVVSRKTFLTFKELYSWGIRPLYRHRPWLELPLGAQNFPALLYSSDDLISCIFIYDPGDLLFGATFSGIGLYSRYDSHADHFADLYTFSRGNVNSSCGCKLWQVGQLLLLLDSMLCHIISPHDRVNDKILAFISLPKWNIRPWLSTLEDKGDFRGEEDTSREYTWELFNALTLWSHFSASRTNNSHLFLTFVFDPGILLCQSDFWDTLLHSSRCSNPNLGFCMSYLTVCVLDELGNSNTWLPLLSNNSLSRIMAMINAFSLVHEIMLNIREGETVQFLIWDPGDTIGKAWIFIACNGIFLATDASSSSFIAYTILFCVFDLGGIKDVNIMSTFKLFKENSRWGKECTASSYHFPMIMAISSFIFDPGGSYDCWAEMWDLVAYECEGSQLEEKTCENSQCYVFDPGGYCGFKSLIMKRFLIWVEGVMSCLT